MVRFNDNTKDAEMELSKTNVAYFAALKSGPNGTVGVCLPMQIAKDGYVYVTRSLFSKETLALLDGEPGDRHGYASVPLSFADETYIPLTGDGVGGVRGGESGS